jgi:hypothetical protein
MASAAANLVRPLRKAPWHLYRCAALRHGDAAPDRAGA